MKVRRINFVVGMLCIGAMVIFANLGERNWTIFFLFGAAINLFGAFRND